MSRILNNNKALVFIIGILIIANIAILVFFLGMRGQMKRGDQRNNDKLEFTGFLKEGVGFNKQQLKQYDSLRKAHWKATMPLFKGMNTAKNNFYAHINDSILDDQLLLNITDSIAKTQKEMDLQMFTYLRNVRNLCSEEQKPLYDSLVENVLKKMVNPGRRDNHSRKTGPNKHSDSADKKL